MKRSEMEKILAKYMTKGSDMLRENEEQEDWAISCASDILDLLEEEGMLPPVVMPPDFMHEELTMVNFLTNDLCVWEDEDE